MKYVLDSGIFMNLHEVPTIPGTHYIPTSAVDEIKSSNSRHIFELFLSQHDVTVLDPDENYLKMAKKASTKIGQTGLSAVDLEVLALVFMLLDVEPVTLISDDYAMKNVAHSENIESIGFKTKGGNQLRIYEFQCNACHEVFDKLPEECDNCGHTKFTRHRRKH